jgi:NitT/TauT family transport system substrate-binding protein
VLRLGYFPNVTHAQALVGLREGSFARAAGVPVEARSFNAGPAAMEALLSGDLDVAYVGPGPAAIAFLRSHGEALRVVAGAVSGGAELVVRPEVSSAADLAGKRVASPQQGNTQDVALRAWLRAQGLADTAGAHHVEVTPVANPDIVTLFARGDLAGAWVPEPWGARILAESPARILVDERTLWPGGKFPSTLVVASARALRERRAQVTARLRAHLELCVRWRRDPSAFAQQVNEAYGALTGKPLAPEVLASAFSRMEAVTDPMGEQLADMARHAQALGFAPAGEVSGMVDGSLLQEIARR